MTPEMLQQLVEWVGEFLDAKLAKHPVLRALFAAFKDLLPDLLAFLTKKARAAKMLTKTVA